MGGQNPALFHDYGSYNLVCGRSGLCTMFFFLDGVPRGHDGLAFFVLVSTGLGIGPSNVSVWLVLMCAPLRAINSRWHVTNSSGAIFLSAVLASIG